ncbi:hypothetical protein [Wolbachia pipientis]|nr:hypothetical protein [Wolbachia pipientis]
MLKYNVLMIMKKLDSSFKHWNDIVYYVPYCNVRTVSHRMTEAEL